MKVKGALVDFWKNNMALMYTAMDTVFRLPASGAHIGSCERRMERLQPQLLLETKVSKIVKTYAIHKR
jgi:hypothetical protein